MSPLVVVAIVIGTLAFSFGFTILAVFSWGMFSLASAMKSLVKELGDLTFALQGLPGQLDGMVPALKGLSPAVMSHSEQMTALVAVIQANTESQPMPKIEIPKEEDEQWQSQGVPPSPFEEEDGLARS